MVLSGHPSSAVLFTTAAGRASLPMASKRRKRTARPLRMRPVQIWLREESLVEMFIWFLLRFVLKD